MSVEAIAAQEFESALAAVSACFSHACRTAVISARIFARRPRPDGGGAREVSHVRDHQCQLRLVRLRRRSSAAVDSARSGLREHGAEFSVRAAPPQRPVRQSRGPKPQHSKQEHSERASGRTARRILAIRSSRALPRSACFAVTTLRFNGTIGSSDGRDRPEDVVAVFALGRIGFEPQRRNGDRHSRAPASPRSGLASWKRRSRSSTAPVRRARELRRRSGMSSPVCRHCFRASGALSSSPTRTCISSAARRRRSRAPGSGHIRSHRTSCRSTGRRSPSPTVRWCSSLSTNTG